MEIVHSLIFYAIAFIVLVSALCMVLSKHIVHSVVSVLITFLSISGIFILLNADFIAISQIIIYGVALVIVLIFAIMLTGEDANKNLWIAKAPRSILSVLIAGGTFLIIFLAITGVLKGNSEDAGIFNIKKPNPVVISQIKKEGTSKIIGVSLFKRYVIPFELLSILLLAVLIGAVIIAKKSNDNLTNPTTKEIPNND